MPSDIIAVVKLLYNLLLILLSPAILLWARGNPRLREGLPERLGQWSREKRAVLGELSGRCIWLHGVSVGEVKLLFPLIRELKNRLPEVPLFLTTTTESGHRLLQDFAAKEGIATSHFPLADFPWAVNRFVSLLRPRVFIAGEAEAWPNLLATLGRTGTRRMLVNARLYLEGKPAWRRWLYRWLYRGFDRICCQHKRAADAFARIGVASDRLVVTGNMKSDMSIPPWGAERVVRLKERFSWQKQCVITAGSTHQGEDELVLSAFARVRLTHPDWVLALVPRHPERGNEVLRLAREMHFNAQCLSCHNRLAFPLSVLIVDEMGVLVDYYQISDVVILGGTFSSRIGGHNIVEPALLGKPVIVGPYVDSIASEVERLARRDGVVCAKGGEELSAALMTLVNNASRRREVGSQGKAVFAELLGPVARTAEIVASEFAGISESEAKSR